MTPVQPVRGTQSLLGEDADRLAAVVAAFDRVRRLYGFKRVEVPTIEQTQVFARTIGETTDVVSKEMYTFDDRSGESITLRPEFTAGICRAYLSEGWQQHAPLKVATHGSAFRYERPQKGRFREFHQLDAEIIGAAEPQADVEIISFGSQLLSELCIDGVTLKLNTLGDADSRDAWRQRLIEHFTGADISPESRERLHRNPLRVLDSKDPRDEAAVAGAPVMPLTAEAEDFFGKVREGLDAAGVKYELDPHLVRGLDYYRHTAFEFVTDRLGSQGAVIAGGRYDGLIEALGGPATPAVGWAAGIERLSMMLGEHPGVDIIDAAVIPLGASAEIKSIEVLATLRNWKIASDMAFRGNVKKRLQRAASAGARFAILLGDDELSRGEASVKHLYTGEQVTVPFGDLPNYLVKLLHAYLSKKPVDVNFVGNELPE